MKFEGIKSAYILKEIFSLVRAKTKLNLLAYIKCYK